MGVAPRRKLRGEFFLHKTTPALHPKILFRQPRMVGNESVVRHAIAIQQNNVIARGGGEGFVEDDRFAKAEVLLPDMAHGRGQLLLPLGDEFAGGGARTVVRHQDFARHFGLTLHAAQAPGRARPVSRKSR